MTLVIGAPRAARVRIDVDVRVDALVVAARRMLRNAAVRLQATVCVIVDRCGRTAAWE